MVGLKVPQPERAFIAGIPVEVRRTRRRRTRIGLAFDPAGIVLVEAPLDATRREVRAVILEHQRWLRHRLEKVTDSAAAFCGQASSRIANAAAGSTASRRQERWVILVSPW